VGIQAERERKGERERERETVVPGAKIDTKKDTQYCSNITTKGAREMPAS
jgi:hypothetical protein